MAVGSVSGSQEWAQFMKLTQAARVRNAGLAGADAAKRAKSPAGGAERGQRAAAPQRPPAAYATRAPSKPQRVLGTRFDAYA